MFLIRHNSTHFFCDTICMYDLQIRKRWFGVLRAVLGGGVCVNDVFMFR